jgi:hypothetical protein
MKFAKLMLVPGALFLSYAAAAPSSHNPCNKNKLFQVQGVAAWSTSSTAPGFFYESGLAVDADGAYRAYHPVDQLGLDSLAHAGRPGNWWALVTDNGKSDGRPLVQGIRDPAPGYFVSMTALNDSRDPNLRNPHRYVDALKFPYVVLHPKALEYARLGDFATVVNLRNGRFSPALVADISAPDLPVGEGSIALAEALDIDPSPRHGGTDGGVLYLIHSGSGNGRPRSLQETVLRSRQLLEDWGGLKKLRACSAGD